MWQAVWVRARRCSGKGLVRLVVVIRSLGWTGPTVEEGARFLRWSGTGAFVRDREVLPGRAVGRDRAERARRGLPASRRPVTVPPRGLPGPPSAAGGRSRRPAAAPWRRPPGPRRGSGRHRAVRAPRRHLVPGGSPTGGWRRAPGDGDVLGRRRGRRPLSRRTAGARRRHRPLSVPSPLEVVPRLTPPCAPGQRTARAGDRQGPTATFKSRGEPGVESCHRELQ